MSVEDAAIFLPDDVDEFSTDPVAGCALEPTEEDIRASEEIRAEIDPDDDESNGMDEGDED